LTHSSSRRIVPVSAVRQVCVLSLEELTKLLSLIGCGSCRSCRHSLTSPSCKRCGQSRARSKVWTNYLVCLPRGHDFTASRGEPTRCGYDVPSSETKWHRTNVLDSIGAIQLFILSLDSQVARNHGRGGTPVGHIARGVSDRTSSIHGTSDAQRCRGASPRSCRVHVMWPERVVRDWLVGLPCCRGVSTGKFMDPLDYGFRNSLAV
jgi:hypothetical protein